ncbi:GEVED domain-containing protein [Flavobacterium sp. K5-23]|uniref:GEVED domain-containing protein n=1 Tax=Flavobacterium sp. K5-23 TaxID=2746225 RepID=UPI00200F4E3D|nr:GEVED domain-containing protein [Flavobacterium sp. K5-23]
MIKKLLSIALIAVTSTSFAQGGDFWKSSTQKSGSTVFENKKQLKQTSLFDLDINGLKKALANSPKRNALSGKSSVVVSFPNGEGKLENFRIVESSNMDPVLAAKYPEIKSYVGQGIENPTATIHFSLSPLGLQTMSINADQSAVFIEPYSTDLSTYTVYKKSDKAASLSKFDCTVIDNAKKDLNTATLRPNADDGNLRTFKLAMSVTGEYTAYFGGTKALALAGINNTMTRVNAIFEKDFGVHMNLIANNDLVIYTSASTDPYSASSSKANWNQQLQTTLTNVIGNANYDVGHLFGGDGGGGNAGCIGCVCKNPTTSVPLGKGSGYTSPGDGIPQGDNFDVDYVAHELGHQFGANHTFTHSNQVVVAQVEPGSGSTIMGYAGITGATDVQAHSDAFFHAISIEQVTNYVKSTTCQTTTLTGNAVPTVNAGLDYTIPKGTPFMLTGVATDANGNVLTYDWEQMNTGTSSTTYPSVTATSGPAFRSFVPSASPTRYFPQLSTVQTGATSWKWEAVPNVARTMNFRLTVRDNHAGGPANNSDDAIVTVNTTAGPFTVDSPNTAVSYVGGSTQTIAWNVAGTTANGVNAANVDILLSTDGGNTYPIIIAAATPNDGTQAVTIPNIAGTQNRIMVKGTNHIFFDISNTDFTITGGIIDNTAPTTPTALSASGTTETTTNLSWNASTDDVAVTGYDVYRGTTLMATVTTTTYNVTGLTASTAYTFSVKAKDAAGNISASSNVINVTTAAPFVDTIAPTAPSSLAASGTTTTTTNLTWTASTDNVGVTDYDVYQGTTLIATVNTTTYNVSGLTAATAYSFSVKAKDAAGNISASSNVANVTTPAVVLSYCDSKGNSVNDEYIGKVQFGTINNPSAGGTGYSDFTAIGTDVTIGTSNTITITPTWTGSVYSEGYAVWIDYNQDGDFDDAGELVWSKAASTTNPVSGTITIPASATTGATRMRVSMKYNGIPSSCETFSYGQVEDYTVTIVAEIVDTTAPTAPSALAASGTTETTTNLSWTASTDNIAVVAYDVYIGTTILGTVTTTSANVTGLNPGTAYSFSVKAKDEAGNVSASSNVVNVTTLTPFVDTIAPTAPTTLTASGTTTTTTNLSWNASTDNVGVTAYDVYQGSTLKATVTTTSYNVTGLSSATAYTFSVKAKDEAGNISASSNVVNVTTLSATLTYCASQGNSVADEKIGKVVFGSINNTSTGGTGYTDFTSKSTNVTIGTSNTITITPDWTGTKYKEGYAVWIDYNQDGDFNDAGELVWSKAASTTTPVSGSFTIPANAKLGTTRMRVSMKYNGIPTACETFSYGQVEDYTVNITSVSKETETSRSSISDIKVYPNPTSSLLNVTSVSENATYRVYNMLGQTVMNGKLSNGSVDVSIINEGNYILEVTDKGTSTVKRFIKK